MRWTLRSLTRREFIAGSATAAAVGFAAAACGGDDGPDPTATREAPAAGDSATATSEPETLAPTPPCADEDETPEQTEGPYFSPNSPGRASLRDPGMAGTPLVVSGLVLSTNCTPIEGALLDFWQCDNDGVYDNEGFTLRGHQFTDADGRYELATIVPGLYPGRTRHIHVKAQAPNQPVLTSQLYFPGEPGNASDGIFDDALLMDVQDAADGKTATFNFVLDVA
jgi:protocatechuate 3,4-dioxygenase beta subunit